MQGIKEFLASEVYSDEKLAALLAHAQDGKLAFCSCCCLAGFVTADHPYRGEMPIAEVTREYHYAIAPDTFAETEFRNLGDTEEERRERIIPLILAEIERRDKLRTSPSPSFSESFPQQQVGA